MSLKQKALGTAIFLGLIIGIAGEHYRQKQQDHRLPASVVSAKSGKAFAVSLQSPSGIAANDDQEVILEAEVHLSQAVPNNELQYTWVLPQGTELVSGHLDDSLPNILPGQTAKLKLSVVGFSQESVEKHITFSAYYQQGSAKIASSAVISNLRNDENEKLPEPPREPSAEGAPGLVEKSQAKPKIKFHR